MSDCNSVWDLLSSYADEEASAAERLVVENHVSRCEACALDLQFLRETASVLSHAPLVTPPPHLRQAILAATVLKPTWQERWRSMASTVVTPRRLQFTGAAASIALVCSILFKGSVQVPMQTENVVPGAMTSAKSTVPLTTLPTGGLTVTRRTPDLGTVTRDTPSQNSRERLAAARPADPVSPRHISGPSRSLGAAVNSDYGRRTTIRISPETGLATAMPIPSDDNSLTEPSTMREASVAMGSAEAAEGAPLVGSETVNPKPGSGSNAPAPPVATRRSYVLSSSPGGGADSMVSFANLRSALRKGDLAARTVALDTGADERRAMVDLFKQRF